MNAKIIRKSQVDPIYMNTEFSNKSTSIREFVKQFDLPTSPPEQNLRVARSKRLEMILLNQSNYEIRLSDIGRSLSGMVLWIPSILLIL